jgi:flagellar motor switch protein FliN
MTERTFAGAAAEELGAIIGALLEVPATIVATDTQIVPRWIIRLTFEGSLTGTLSIGIAEEDATTLARLTMGLDDVPPEAAIADTLLEVCAQGIAALGERADFKGLRLSSSQHVSELPPVTPVSYRVTAGERFSGAFCVWDQTVIAIRREPSAGSVSSATGDVLPLNASLPPNLDVILDIDLPLSVRFGETEMTLLELTRLGPGSVIDLGRPPDDPVDVLVHGRLVARGEVVVVSGNYGVRITDVISAADRLRTVAG